MLQHPSSPGGSVWPCGSHSYTTGTALQVQAVVTLPGLQWVSRSMGWAWLSRHSSVTSEPVNLALADCPAQQCPGGDQSSPAVPTTELVQQQSLGRGQHEGGTLRTPVREIQGHLPPVPLILFVPRAVLERGSGKYMRFTRGISQGRRKQGAQGSHSWVNHTSSSMGRVSSDCALCGGRAQEKED